MFFIFSPLLYKFIASSLEKMVIWQKKKEENYVHIWGKLLNFTYAFVFSDKKRKRHFQSLIFVLSEYLLVERLSKRKTLYDLSLHKLRKKLYF